MVTKDLDKLIENIEQASSGAEVRNSIVDAFDSINSKGGNATKFDGHDAAWYSLKSEGDNNFDMLMTDIRLLLDNVDDNPKQGGFKLVESGNVFNYIDALLNRLNVINGGAYDGNTPTPEKGSKKVAAALKYLSDTKALIRTAITDKGGTIDDDNDSFEDYAKALEELKLWNLETKKIDKNGNHKVEPGNSLWNVIQVDVKPVVREKTITEEGTYDVKDEEGVDAWNPVNIMVPGAKTGSGGSSYNPSGSGGSGGKTKDEIEGEHIDVFENGVYHVSESYDAINSVHVDLNGIDPAALALMSFNVDFVDDDGTILESHPNVQGGTTVRYDGPRDEHGVATGKLPIKESDDGSIYTFSYWMPNPIYVDHDMTCTAVYSEAIYSKSDSQLSWDDICNGGGQVGDTKTLNLLPCTDVGTWSSSGPGWFAKEIGFGPIRMECVSTKGGKTWVSRDLLYYFGGGYAFCIWYNLGGNANKASVNPVSGYFVGSEVGAGKEVTEPELVQASTKLGWANSPIRIWLNTKFYQCIPEKIRNAIRPVTLTCYCAMTNQQDEFDSVDAFKTMNAAGISLPGLRTFNDKQTTYSLSDQKVWIPSVREIWGAYSKNFGKTEPPAQSSINKFVAVESSGNMWSAYSHYIDTPDGWNDPASQYAVPRPDALRNLYGNISDQGPMIKHISYYPYEEIIGTNVPTLGNPYNSNGLKYAKWPTRSFYQGRALAVNSFGNSKDDMSKAADEDLQSETVNLTSVTDNGIGLCFAFTI